MTKPQTLLLVIFLSSFGLFASANDRWETLHAINMVENPTNQTGFGSKGELGPYQFRSSTWHMYSTKPFRMANDRESADQVAIKHYEWIKEHLSAAGIDPNGFNIALAWNCGITAVINGKVPMQTYHYAERVNNLAVSYRQPEQEESVPVITIAKSNSTDGVVALNLDQRNDTPEFKIVSNPFVLRIAGEAPRFVVAPVQPRFVLVAN